jgi:hypothetical protein
MAIIRFRALLAAALLSLTVSKGHAQSIQLPPDDLFQTTTTAGKVYCGRISNRWVPGSLAKDGQTFTRFTDSIKKLKREIKKAKGRTKAKKEKQLAALGKKQAAGRTKCAKGKVGVTPTPAPTTPGGGGGGSPTPPPTPTRTPTPSTSTNCFVGDNTNTSRSPSQCFGIPGTVQGNVSRGASLWISRSCQGCHTAKNGKTFSQILGSFSSVPNMAACS